MKQGTLHFVPKAVMMRISIRTVLCCQHIRLENEKSDA